MSDTCPKPVQVCGEQQIATAAAPECPDWDICLPFGGRLYKEGDCIRHVPGNPPPDGVYGLITVAGGCIVSADAEPVSKYQGDPCAPVPCPCDSEGATGTSNLCNPSTTSGNLYECDMAGRPLVRAYVTGSDNVTVTGNGTSTNPYRISIDQGDAGVTNLTSNSAALIVRPNTGAVTIEHKTGYNDRTIMGMVFDEWGHLTAYNEQGATGVTGIVPGGGIAVETDQSSGIATIELEEPANHLQGDYTVGGWTLTLDKYNRVYNMHREIEGTLGTRLFGQYNVTLNNFGSVTELEQLPDPGTCIHGMYTTTNANAVRRNITFNLRYTSSILVDIRIDNGPAGWGDQLVFRVDDAPMTITQVFDFSTTTTTTDSAGQSTTVTVPGPQIVRVAPTGIYALGAHVLTIHSPAGFPSNEPMSVTIRPVQSFTSSELLTADQIAE